MSGGNYSDGAAWYCLRSKTKREHIAAAQLKNCEGVEVFCPRVRFQKTTRRGPVWWTEAMFPGYFMAHFDYESIGRQVTSSHGVTGMIRFGDSVPEVPVSLIDELKKITSEDEQILELVPTVEVGDEVELTMGAFKGIEGTVHEILPASERVVVLIELMGEVKPLAVPILDLLLPKRPH